MDRGAGYWARDYGDLTAGAVQAFRQGNNLPSDGAGEVSSRAAHEIGSQRARHPIGDERDLRVIVAHAAANASNPRYWQDVLSRKLTLATGAGAVHGGTYVLRNWGLADLPV